MNIELNLISILNKDIKDATTLEIYEALLQLIKNYAQQNQQSKHDKKLYYISAEFLIGKLLSNNCINLGIYDDIQNILLKNGKSMKEIEEFEPEPSLGNGGLGRLASCFLDSIATLGLPGDGIGLNYHFGLFKQVFEENKQTEIPNPWIQQNSWLTQTNHSFTVEYKDFSIHSKLYDMDIIGYNNKVNKLHLFDIETIDESIITSGITFDKSNIHKNLTLFLYPDDSDEAGHKLRIYQQYFMVSNGVQYILQEAKKNGYNLNNLEQHVVVQINDTHPTLVIPEFIYQLRKEGILMRDAIAITSKICAYTNHTILAEALEKWPLHYLEEITPHLIPIIEALDSLVSSKFQNDQVQIIDSKNLVHMARICIHYSFSVNGVAAIHTDILKSTELNDFYKIYPNKFNNKTNGITFRRWLMHSNHELSDFITNKIGNDWKKDASELEKLLQFENDENTLNELVHIKKNKKINLCNEILKHENIELDPNSIFCIQIKRLHEYKRQQMNALYIISKIIDIENGVFPSSPITFIFGAKAAPAYIMAKNIIHLLLCLQEYIHSNPLLSKYLNVVMVENYNVTYAEKLIPACDISEQISLASKEASGTGNMKFMLNGAITLGTNDGANVEIAELVGDHNIYTFGESSDQIIEHYKKSDYISKDFYKKPQIKPLLDFIISDKLFEIGDAKCLTDLFNELINKDWFMTLLDLEEYIRVKDQAILDYQDMKSWKKKMLVNIAKAGFFSSDRTIAEYNNDIWKL